MGLLADALPSLTQPRWVDDEAKAAARVGPSGTLEPHDGSGFRLLTAAIQGRRDPGGQGGCSVGSASRGPR